MKFDAELRMRYRTMKTSLFIYLSIIIFSIHIAQAQASKMNSTQQSEKIIRSFLQIVRSGKAPERAAEFMADTVIAHQMNAEKQEAIKRTPQNYMEHIKEFLTLYGPYTFEITELIASDNKVYARWVQTGKHLADIDQYKATGLPLTEIGSAVYRIENGKIAEYWIQIDRQGFEAQLQQNERTRNQDSRTKIKQPFTFK
jgi:predicted ester cyclase